MTSGDPAQLTTAASGSYVLAWDPTRRLLRVRFSSSARINDEHAAGVERLVRGWAGDEPAPYGWLVDATGLHASDVDSRSRLT